MKEDRVDPINFERERERERERKARASFYDERLKKILLRHFQNVFLFFLLWKSSNALQERLTRVYAEDHKYHSPGKRVGKVFFAY